LTQDDALFRFRVRVFALAAEMGNVRAACRAFGIHPSTYYRWKRQVERFGIEILNPRERRRPRMPNSTSPMIEQRVLAYALAFPTVGPQRISDELARPKWGEIIISPNGVHKVLKRHGLNTKAKRLGLVAGYAAPYEPIEREPQPERHIEADHPGELVQMDCFCIGRLSGAKGTAWQYTAIDVASSYCWAEIHMSPKNAQGRFTSALARRVAEDLSNRGWRLEKVSSDNGSEFRSTEFREAIAKLKAGHVFIRAGRPQSNGCVERVQLTILEECWKPTFARYLIPKYTGLRLDLERYLKIYNTDRPHHGRLTQGRTPEEIIGKVKMWTR
jgi:transposase InsO family protein